MQRVQLYQDPDADVPFGAMQPMQMAMIQHLAEGTMDIETGLRDAQGAEADRGEDGAPLHGLPCHPTATFCCL